MNQDFMQLNNTSSDDQIVIRYINHTSLQLALNLQIFNNLKKIVLLK